MDRSVSHLMDIVDDARGTRWYRTTLTLRLEGSVWACLDLEGIDIPTRDVPSSVGSASEHPTPGLIEGVHQTFHVRRRRNDLSFPTNIHCRSF